MRPCIQDWLELSQQSQPEQPFAHITAAEFAPVNLPAALQFRGQASLLPVAPTEHVDAIGEALHRLRVGFKSVRRAFAIRNKCHGLYILPNAN